jgi:hypothetical protein
MCLTTAKYSLSKEHHSVGYGFLMEMKVSLHRKGSAFMKRIRTK